MMKRLVLCLTGILSCGAACAQTATQPATQPWMDATKWHAIQPTTIQDVVYSAPSGVDQHLSIFQATAGKPMPVVIHIHGGGWSKGQRLGQPGAVKGFLAAGLSVVTIDYRLSPQFKAPAQMEDVHCAMAWAKANAKKYNWDPDHVILWGSSAGGHLSLMGGYATQKFLTPGCTDLPRVVAVLDDYGPADLVLAMKQSNTEHYAQNWLGAGVDALAAAKEYSPITYLNKNSPPTFIVNGDADPTVSPEQDALLKRALDQLGVADGQYIVPGGKHGGFGPAENEKAMMLRLKFLEAQKIIP